MSVFISFLVSTDNFGRLRVELQATMRSSGFEVRAKTLLGNTGAIAL